MHRLKLLYPADPARLLFGLARSVIPTWFLGPYISWPDPYILGKGKGNIDLYNSSSQTPLMCSDMDHTVLSANNTISAFTRKLSPGVATMRLHIANDEFILLLIYRPQEEWLSWPCWLTYSGQFTLRRSPVNAMVGPVSTGIGDCIGVQLPVWEICLSLTNHPGQLSLAIRPWVGVMSTAQKAVMFCDWE